MKPVLAMAWRLSANGIARFAKILPLINELYCGISIVTPPNNSKYSVEEIKSSPTIKLFIRDTEYENRRYLAIRHALEFEQATHVHYCDGDHVLSRMELYLSDWMQIIQSMTNTDCLIIGRSLSVFEAYPNPLRETERIINMVGSYLLNQSADLGSGSRGLSRRAVEFLVRYASPETHGIATDAEWVVLLQRAGFRIETYESDGAIYEIADETALQHLQSVDQWAKRTELARKIIQAGIEASNRRDLPTDHERGNAE